MKTMTEIWNEAVKDVGGRYNTMENFKNIAFRFFVLGEQEGYKMLDLTAEVNSIWEEIDMRKKIMGRYCKRCLEWDYECKCQKPRFSKREVK